LKRLVELSGSPADGTEASARADGLDELPLDLDKVIAAAGR
jgi:hypothetical protein